MPSSDVPQEDTVQAKLPQAVAVQLGAALVQSLAETLQVRALILKGSAATIHGFRPVLQSSDVDVLLSRADAGRLMGALEGRGWRRRRTAPAPRQFELHSETLFHPEWPCDIDIHWRYPGLFAEPEVVLDRLWETSMTAPVAGRDVRMTDATGTALILAVHALRDPDRPRSETDLAAVATRLEDPAFARRFRDEVVRLRAQYPLRALFARSGETPPGHDLTPGERGNWDLEVESSGSTTLHWYVAFVSAPLRRKPRLVLSLARALLLALTASRAGYPNGGTPASRKLREALTEIGRLRRARARGVE
ncbi:hypothetical protein GSU69_12470 [Rathayibacter festucae]|uniref:Nucleotidyltransferase family protein n=1 Tax=Rathayibacter festucae TaxID=110937 RepID=A0ABX6H0U6_9MICO|nr:nucleotidyltransferase family protein [Rathayibacter festucae]QHC63414.1 hypothetical protein GSU69_12470 [Rathayibacter festucae]